MKTLKRTQLSLQTTFSAILLTSLLLANIAVGIHNRQIIAGLQRDNEVTRQFAFDTYKVANGEIEQPKKAADHLAVVENGGH